MIARAAPRVELIAEVASNHGGDLQLAKAFIWRCAEAGADWVKFQTTRVQHLRLDDPQYAWFQRAELSEDAHVALKDECAHAGVKFLTTVYHPAEMPFLASLGLEAIKIGSGEARELALARAVTGFPRVIVSLGVAPTGALTPFRHVRQAVFLRCVSRYPTPPLAALGAMRPYLNNSTPEVGWSDHCVGIEVACAAICAGATLIEKHVQFPDQARPPQPYEATMDDLKRLRQFADEDPASQYTGRWQHG